MSDSTMDHCDCLKVYYLLHFLMPIMAKQVWALSVFPVFDSLDELLQLEFQTTKIEMKKNCELYLDLLCVKFAELIKCVC